MKPVTVIVSLTIASVCLGPGWPALAKDAAK